MASASPVTLRIDSREFNATLRQYLEVSKRDLVTALNTKAFFIARRATLETPRVPKGRIPIELRVRIAKVKELNPATGRMKTFRRAVGTGTPLAALIINARRGRQGKPGLFGSAMEVAIRKLLGVREKSRAFLASGWIPAIKLFEQYVDPKYRRGAPKRDPAPKQIGAPKGAGKVAVAGWRPKAIISNTASTKRDTKQALFKYGAPALQRAFDFEILSMKEYLGRKLIEAASRAGIKHHGTP